ncbi:hypothetical protein UFOVP824_35 [uncultured Caudovirales phage]|uniref:Uncharacterized protein n=1 Tax=uncultured Caudovirales phage TaxID=2100421 RepID=A0A6J5P7Y6_9CAUD|nr:hypothetical protein UFOVP824_35 [uncultured Caudovirales phage]
MNRLQLTKRVKDLNRAIRTARSYIGFQLSDNQSKDEQIATLTSEVETLNTAVADLSSSNDAIVAERDASRILYCEYDNSVYTKEEIAAQQGWEYLYDSELPLP